MILLVEAKLHSKAGEDRVVIPRFIVAQVFLEKANFLLYLRLRWFCLLVK